MKRIVAALCLLMLGAGWPDGWSIAKHRAHFAIQAALLPSPSLPDPGQCSTCGGDGVLGDGRIEIACPDCSAGSVATTPAQQVQVPVSRAKRTPRLVVFGAPWCVACGRLNRSLASLPDTWTQGTDPYNVIQKVDVSTELALLRAQDFYGVDFEQLPAIYAYWSPTKSVKFDRPTINSVEIAKWFNEVANREKRRSLRDGLITATEPPEPLAQQFVAELYRVTGTQQPVGAIDVDLTEKTAGVPEILAQVTAGKMTPAQGVVIESTAGLWPSRTSKRPDGATRLHFDQRPRITVKKLILKLNGQLQWIDLSADGRAASVSISGLPDVELKL